MSSGQNMFTKGQTGELAWVTSSNIPSPLKWFLGPFSDFASSLSFKSPPFLLSGLITISIYEPVIWRWVVAILIHNYIYYMTVRTLSHNLTLFHKLHA